MPSEKAKLEWVKALGPIIISVLSLISAIFVGILQTYSASNSEVENIVAHINGTLIPSIQDAVTEVRERQARLEGQLELMLERSVLSLPKDTKFFGELRSGPPEKKDFKIPKLKVQQMKK